MDRTFDSQKLDSYLNGDMGYYVPDHYTDKAEIVLFMESPFLGDTVKGSALSDEENGRRACGFLFGQERVLGDDHDGIEKIGIMYVSNVPLYNRDGAVSNLVGELEYTRLHSYADNKILIQRFNNKIREVIENPNIKYIVLVQEFVKRYFGGFITKEQPEVLSVLQDRIAGGTLRVLYVPPICFWGEELENNSGVYPYDLYKLKEIVGELCKN